ncbi:hypothetical protein LXA43DRAFT_1098143 [Ganoderma leucocontextum]|nr:hypothetical protein LXA43DRAFT_1098143 [Ganoderma leucocontextum]
MCLQDSRPVLALPSKSPKEWEKTAGGMTDPRWWLTAGTGHNIFHGRDGHGCSSPKIPEVIILGLPDRLGLGLGLALALSLLLLFIFFAINRRIYPSGSRTASCPNWAYGSIWASCCPWCRWSLLFIVAAARARGHFFTPASILNEIVIQDPSHMGQTHLENLWKHIYKLQNWEDPEEQF